MSSRRQVEGLAHDFWIDRMPRDAVLPAVHGCKKGFQSGCSANADEMGTIESLNRDGLVFVGVRLAGEGYSILGADYDDEPVGFIARSNLHREGLQIGQFQGQHLAPRYSQLGALFHSSCDPCAGKTSCSMYLDVP